MSAGILAKLAILGVVLGIVLLGLWIFAPATFTDMQHLLDREMIEAQVARAGVWGPVLIVALMTLAVVASLLPSAPIALAAGAAYGQFWGTFQVVLGAELGALIAFAIARILGRDGLRRLFGDRVDAGLLGSQNALTAAVFVSRLMPFVSFDMMSYAAGLSALHAWRFALATFAGIVPASYVLVHVGAAATNGNLGNATWMVLGLGMITGLPLLWLAMCRRPAKDQ